MKKLMIILMLLKTSKESKRKCTYDEVKDSNRTDPYDLCNHCIHNDTYENFSQFNSSNIKQLHAKLEKLICPIKYMLPNKYDDLPVLSEEDVNICLNDAENISNPAVMLEVSSINSSSLNEIPNLKRRRFEYCKSSQTVG
ncbi:hypothetical protein NBO_885g0001 [Nosema bombycis CQ1]|uniref:Uncharacterized protein n=1 Tax=Nosema bombycis (strain CQ1 / CVCC 102059) TaxID=578461 RepID=R0MG87_NOSB1|nr:hypothetical protein NBO_885g0001 [Nosema bombycis CQ1]|eukprot:EOB11768.1 hypothetical protein NBO_885g0001 [Nosema bombycis CQ1]